MKTDLRFLDVRVGDDTFAIYCTTPTGRLRRIDLTREEGLACLAQMAIAVAQQEGIYTRRPADA